MFLTLSVSLSVLWFVVSKIEARTKELISIQLGGRMEYETEDRAIMIWARIPTKGHLQGLLVSVNTAVQVSHESKVRTRTPTDPKHRGKVKQQSLVTDLRGRTQGQEGDADRDLNRRPRTNTKTTQLHKVN